MSTQTRVYWLDNSMLVELEELTDESDDSLITAGVAVQGEIFDKDGVSLGTVAMSHESGGLWRGIAGTDMVDGAIAKGDQIKVVWRVDGGSPTSQGSWVAYPIVKEREV